MSIPVIIGGSTYNIPEQGTNPPWGDELTSLLLAIVTELNTLAGPYDINTTSFTIANNVSSPANVTGLSFDSSAVRAAVISYSIYRSSNNPTEVSESGQLMLTYKSTANAWELARYSVGSAGITFTVTALGQVQYVSTDIGSGAYIGRLKFNARAFAQA